MTAVEKNVLRFDVAVDDTHAMRVCERLTNFFRDRERVVDRKLLLAIDTIPQ